MMILFCQIEIIRRIGCLRKMSAIIICFRKDIDSCNSCQYIAQIQSKRTTIKTSLADLTIQFCIRKNIDQLHAKQKHFRFDFTFPPILF